VLFFFWPTWAVLIFAGLGLAGSLTFTLWPLIQRQLTQKSKVTANV
jgi:hypothetical protein